MPSASGLAFPKLLWAFAVIARADPGIMMLDRCVQASHVLANHSAVNKRGMLAATLPAARRAACLLTVLLMSRCSVGLHQSRTEGVKIKSRSEDVV
jgi:hypothetical protein